VFIKKSAIVCKDLLLSVIIEIEKAGFIAWM